MARETQGTNIDPGIIARVAAGLRYAFTGNAPVWFGPMEPLPPVVPEAQRESVEGRQFDYPVGFNSRVTPRDSEPVSFAQMRALADGYDLLRLVIETRKDQVAKLSFSIRPIDAKLKPDSRCQTLQDFFRMPDSENIWQDWLRQLIEEMLVTDAACIYPRMTLGGELMALDLMDGATIKRVIDQHGRTPQAPDPAYQQILKGMPAINYTRDELIYRPRNKRVWKLYGYSPVEQVIMTVNIALRRQLHQLQYYTDGATPDLIFSVPKEWNPDQIRQFSDWWNSLLTGNTAERRGAKFVPDGVKPIDTKEKALKDDYDEWLARIVCFAFGIEATPFIKQQNRSTSETVREQALSEGLAPIMGWVKSILDFILAKYLDAPDLNAVWDDEESTSPLEKAQIDQIYLAAKVYTPDEVRGDLGREPLTDEQKAELNPPMPEPLAAAAPGDAVDPAQKPNPASAKEAFAKAKKPVAPEDKPAVAKQIIALRAALTEFLADQAPKIADQLSGLLGITKADEVDDQQGEARRKEKADAALMSLSFDEWAESLPDETETYLAAVAVDGGGAALADLGITDASVDALMRKRAEAWANTRAAEMVGKKWVDGELVDNPDATWVITDGTRELLRATTEQALDEGWSTQEFSRAIADNHAFSEARADMIARTELAFADVAGNAQGWKASGVVSAMQFVAAPDCCDECQDHDGEIIALDDIDSAPPIHPNCRCNTVAVLDDEE